VASVDALVVAIERDEYLPSGRAGDAAGRALHRVGDWFGPPVNLASRIAGIAEPGSTLATRAVVDAAGGAARWSDCGSRSLKGVDAPVALFRVERD
jgi:adenylate cyclase